MAYDKAVDSSVLDAGLKQIADAIREKGGTTDSLAFPAAMAEAIAAIEAGGGGGLPVAAYGSVILSEDQTTEYTIETGISLANKSMVVFQKNKTNEKINGSLLYTSNFGQSVIANKKISAGYRGGGTADIYAAEGAGIKRIDDGTRLVIGGNATANYSYGFKAGVEYIWLVLEG